VSRVGAREPERLFPASAGCDHGGELLDNEASPDGGASLRLGANATGNYQIRGGRHWSRNLSAAPSSGSTRPAESTGGPRCVGSGCARPAGISVRWCVCPIGLCLSSDRRNDRGFDSLYVRSRRTAARTPSPPQRRVARVATVPGRTWMREGARGGRLPGRHGPPRPQAREPCKRMRMGSGLDEAGEVRPRRGRPGEPRPRYPRPAAGTRTSCGSWLGCGRTRAAPRNSRARPSGRAPFARTT
jgi:hypothetical protein